MATTIQDIIDKVKSYNKRSDTKLIMKAYDYAEGFHKGQLRKSNEPYIIHPLEVAYIVSTLELDDNAICAALLHDVVEDTPATFDDIKKEFNEEVATLVDGVTKLGKIASYIDKEEEQVETQQEQSEPIEIEAQEAEETKETEE
jgi:GTP pyrophosphokinase